MKHFFSVFALCLIFFTSCGSKEEVYVPSSEKELLKFEVEGATTEIKDNIIYLSFGVKQKDFNLPVKFVTSEKSTINIHYNYKLQLDAKDLIIKVQAEDSSIQEYTIQIILAEGLNSVRIETYSMWEGKTVNLYAVYEGDIDDTNKKITFKIPFEFVNQYFRYGSMLKTTYYGKKEFVTVPNENEFLDFNLFKEYYIIDLGNEESFKYEIVLLNTDAFIKEIELPLLNPFINSSTAWDASMTFFDYNKEMDRYGHIVFALENENIKDIKPISITKTHNSTLSPDENESRDFTNDVVYVGTSEAGNQYNITIRVIKQKVMANPDGNSNRLINKKGEFDFVSISPIVSGVLVHSETKQTYEMESITINDSYYYPKTKRATFVMKDDLPAKDFDNYTPRFVLENGDVTDVNVRFYIAE